MILVATACMGGRYDYSGYNSIDASGWAYGDTLRYNIALNDSIQTGRLLIDITHDNFYPYSNLWVEVTIPGDSTSVMRDTVDIRLCDPLGHWHGKGIEGHYQLETELIPRVTLRNNSTVTLRHIMRVDTIHNISQIGLTLEKP